MKVLTSVDSERLSELRASRTIGVLMGGPSEEREISLKSGSAVVTHLAEAGYRAEPCDFRTQDELRAQLLEKKIDFVFLALHGRYGEDGTVQRFLESLNVSYTGSSAEASRVAFDKWATWQILRDKGLLTPRAIVVGAGEAIPAVPFDPSTGSGSMVSVSRTIDFPIVVKPVCQGSSLGLSIVDTPETLPEAVQEAFQHDHRILIEEYIPGPELTVGILGDEALPIIQILPANRCYDYDAKYFNAKTQYLVPAPVNAELGDRVQHVALKTHQALGCRDFSRVDILLKERTEPVILEINTIPGLTSRSLLPKACGVAGISFLELCERILLMAVMREQLAQESTSK
ncbi:MAG: D-alanine--D-alanine ligase [Candidatus Omnitrophota bacterium]